MKGVTAYVVVFAVATALLAPQVLTAQEKRNLQVVPPPTGTHTGPPPSLVDPDPTAWKLHVPNPRFRIYGTETDDLRDDLVLDRETGLLWLRDLTRDVGVPEVGFRFSYPDAVKKAINVGRQGRKGFRLPTVDELATLLYITAGTPNRLPPGHPFVDVKTGADDWYFTSTPDPSTDGNVFCVYFARGEIASKAVRDSKGKYTDRHYAYHWPVRIGHGVLAEVN